MKSVKTILVTLFFIFFQNAITRAATPFDAPAVFDLAGSTVSLSASFQTLRGETEAALDPNPAAVSGKITIDTLSKNSGAFTGEFQGVSASTTISGIPGLDDPTLSVALNSQTNGMFLWSQGKVVFNAEYLTAVLAIGGQEFQVPLRGAVIPATYGDGVITLQLQIEKSGTYGAFDFTVKAVMSLTGTVQSASNGAPWIAFSSESAIYQQGDTFRLYATLGNSGATQDVDLYIGMVDPQGALFLLAPDLTWTGDLVPVLTGYTCTPETLISGVKIFQEQLPSLAPPVEIEGEYQFLAAFTQPGTMDIVGEIPSFVMNYAVAANGSGSYDGIYMGKAESSVQGVECAPLASVVFEIQGNKLSGSAGEDDVEEADGYSVTATVDANGVLSNGVLWEEYMNSLVPVGSFDGTVANGTLSGTWNDTYGCYGTYSLQRYD